MNPYNLPIRELSQSIEEGEDAIEQKKKELIAEQKQQEARELALEILKRLHARHEHQQPTVKPKAFSPAHRRADAGSETDLMGISPRTDMPYVEIPAAASTLKMKALQAIRDTAPDTFNVRDVEQGLIAQGNAVVGSQPRSRIATAMAELVAENYLIMVAKGRGGIPSSFRLRERMSEDEIIAIKSPTGFTGLGL